MTFAVAPNTGPARTGTILVALQTVTVTQDAFIDVTPPTVTPPAGIAVFATVPGGATPATVPALAAFLLGATAVDDATTSPVAQPPLFNGVAITPTTVFAVGGNVVTFGFSDAAGNLGTATAVVVVQGGRPQLTARIESVAPGAAGQRTATLVLTNVGTGNALDAAVTLSLLRTLAGTGTVTLASGLPRTGLMLAPGASTSWTITMNVPTTVLRFAITEAITMRDYTGALLSTTATQTIFP